MHGKSKCINLYRVVDRKGVFSQSGGSIHARRIGPNWRERVSLTWKSDFFHSMLEGNAAMIFGFGMLLYFILCCLFAGFYYAMNDRCKLAFDGGYLDALFFSIETMYTIGYGAAGGSVRRSEHNGNIEVPCQLFLSFSYHFLSLSLYFSFFLSLPLSTSRLISWDNVLSPFLL